MPDFLNARIDGLSVKEVIKDHKWLEEEFTQKVQKVTCEAAHTLVVFFTSH